ncbi:MAG: TetR/AcrR family transcriptional regulator [Acidimicrobiia bacterium]|nr:TetR/AcrR family transcriptional regulator [Acidimicrobiia bacterium]
MMGETATDRIIEATFALVAERGLGSVTMTEIADRAGVARQTLYNHFSDVEQIIVVGIEEYAQTGFTHLMDLLAATGSVEAKLDLLVRHTVVEGSHGHGAADVRAALSPEARAHLDRHQNDFRSLVASIIADGLADGSFDASIDPNRHAVLVQGLLLSASDLAAEGGDPADLAAVVSESILRVLRAP